jgi:2-polyprenyl-3-methyl-5-hydroxy-6-metoxy-1,4-benzoquinol methylase
MHRMSSKLDMRLRILVAIASYGTSNDHYLSRLIREYRSMSFDVKIVILSNIKKQLDPDIEVLVGMPNKDPWSLPFPHKKVFVERLDAYDMFVYSEDDMLVTERNIRSFLDVSDVLQEGEIAGFFRVEQGPNGSVNYPDVHAYFHWVPSSVRLRGKYTLAHFTNEHAACYVLTRDQLRRAVKSGGFLVEPHDELKYDLICAAATDPYTQCELIKLIPISHFNDFTIQHLSNKYVGKVGVDAFEMQGQIGALMQNAGKERFSTSLFKTETKLKRGMYSKDYYECPDEEIISMIPREARSVLSIGCGWGAMECRLAERGLRVTAVPLDSVVSARAAARGVEMAMGDLDSVRGKLRSERFDCVVYSNVLHLARDPVEVLALCSSMLTPDSVIIISTPNMLCLPKLWRMFQDAKRLGSLVNYESTGVHFTTKGQVCNWSRTAELEIRNTNWKFSGKAKMLRKLTPSFLKSLVASDFIALAQKVESAPEVS